MGKSLFIAEKPSVAQEFAKALKQQMTRHDGYQEGPDAVVTWCVGHLITMSYPDAYDPALKRWTLETLPFLPDQWLYEVIPSVSRQFQIVKKLLNRQDVETIYVCTDSGREGEYIYRLVAQEAGVSGKSEKRVWIDSQTEEEVLRGIREAKDLHEYDHLADAAYLRAKEDYLMGINFSRALTLKYGNQLAQCLGEKRCVISVGRVMTCVLGMIVRREREVRSFVKTPFYRILADTDIGSADGKGVSCEWKALEGSRYFASPALYKDNGFREKDDALAFTDLFGHARPLKSVVEKIERRKEKKNPPLLYNLAELQNDCSRRFHISPDQTLAIAQELYEKKLITYPRTDARVLSTAVAKEIQRNITGLRNFSPAAEYAVHILEEGSFRNIGKSRYTNDKQITDHYALIPTGQGLGALKNISRNAYGVYCLIVRRFLSIFYPPAVYSKAALTVNCMDERFCGSLRTLEQPGYLAVMPGKKKKEETEKTEDRQGEGETHEEEDPALLEAIAHLRKGTVVFIRDFEVKEGETSPPKRYNSGSMILAMENAGQLIEDEELRAQIKGSGIGTSATRAEILKKLTANGYIALNQKTQILTPTLMGEMIHDIVYISVGALLNPELTASWEKGLTFVAEGRVGSAEYMEKLNRFVGKNTETVKNAVGYQSMIRDRYAVNAPFYRNKRPGAGTAEKASETAQRKKGGGRKKALPAQSKPQQMQESDAQL